MRKYELTYLISDEVPESDLNKVTGQVTGFVGDLGGKIAKEDIWGRRKLAYPIRKQDFATYVTLYFEMPSEKANEFDRDLRHTEGILRHLLIVKDLGAEAITLTAEDIADTEEIKDVIGGEKSFEAVEGETEESRDLMAKRETEDRVEAETAEPEIKEEIEEVKKEVAKKADVIEEKPVEEAAPEAVETVVGVKEEKTEAPAKPKAEKKKAATKKEESPKVEDKKAEKSEAKASEKKKVDDEVERLSKLNEELDDILKDEL